MSPNSQGRLGERREAPPSPVGAVGGAVSGSAVWGSEVLGRGCLGGGSAQLAGPLVGAGKGVGSSAAETPRLAQSWW